MRHPAMKRDTEEGTMDNWGGSTLYDLALTLHTERVARGAAAQHQAATLGAHPVRTRLAATLAALATRLDPALAPAPQQVVPLAA